MDRHICRARRKDNNRWVKGYYVALRDTTYCFKEDYDAHPDNTKYYIAVDEMTDWGLPNEHHLVEVDPETVCQCTGMTEFVMTDKSVNSPLFEGDIVEVWSRRRPIGENITLYRDNTTSKYDIETKVRAVIYFNNGQWCLDYDNVYNNAICGLKGNEQNKRTVKASHCLYDFGFHRKDVDRFRELNQRNKWHDIVRIGNKFDNHELLETQNEM